MPRYIIRKNCEYSTVIEAEDEEQALQQASETPDEHWDCAWSPTEAELEDHEPISGPGGVGRTDMPAGMRGDD